MAYIKGEDKQQKVLFPNCIEGYAEEDAPLRFFDTFIDSLGMENLGFVRSTSNQMGTPSYDPRDIFKLWVTSKNSAQNIV